MFRERIDGDWLCGSGHKTDHALCERTVEVSGAGKGIQRLAYFCPVCGGVTVRQDPVEPLGDDALEVGPEEDE